MTDPGHSDRLEMLKGMTSSGLAEFREGEDGKDHLEMSDFGRRGIGVIMAAVRMERRVRPDQIVPLSLGDGLTFLMGTLPLARLPEETQGTCVLTMELDKVPGSPGSARVWAKLRGGRVVSYSEHPPRRPPSAFATGSVEAWLDALLDGNLDRLHIGGRRELAAELITGIHDQLPGSEGMPASDESAKSLFHDDPRPPQLGEALPPVTRPGMGILDLLTSLGPNEREILKFLGDRPAAKAEEIAHGLGLQVDQVERTCQKLNEMGLLADNWR